jgi:hypothetical protein
VLLADLVEQVEAGDVRQGQVQHHAVEALAGQRLERRRSGLGRHDAHVGIADQRDDRFALGHVVLDHQQRTLAAHQEFLDAREFFLQHLAADRLVDIGDRALAQRALALAQRRDHVHRDMAGAGVALEAVEHRQAVDVRQVDVEQDRGRLEVARQRQRRVAAVGDDALEVLLAGEFEQGLGEALVILDDQHRRVARRDQAAVVQHGRIFDQAGWPDRPPRWPWWRPRSRLRFRFAGGLPGPGSGPVRTAAAPGAPAAAGGSARS